jgi:hypothetical protein
MPIRSSSAVRFTRISIALVVVVAAIAATARAQSPASSWGASRAPTAGRHVDLNGIGPYQASMFGANLPALAKGHHIVVLQSLHHQAPDHQLVLRETTLERAPEVIPPGAVEGVRHDLVHHDVVALRRPVGLGPQALRRRARVSGEPVEPVRQRRSDGGVVRGWKGAALVVVEGEEQLNEMDDASDRRE